jgi:outer membrane protein assembly factor BamB
MNRRYYPVALVLLAMLTSQLHSDDWAQWRGANRDGRWTEDGVVREFKQGDLKTLWRQPISPGYNGPTVANGRVFVMDRITEPKQIERVLCFDEATGEPLWKHEYDAVYEKVGYEAGPRASVTVDGQHVFSLGSMGHLFCLTADKGDVVWAADLNQQYKIVQSDRMPIWGIAGSPLIFGELVIVHLGAAEGACLVAFDKSTGKERWRALDDRGQYSSPILYQVGEKQILICWTGDHVAGLNPGDGTVYWKVAMSPRNMPIGIATPIVKNNRVFVTSFYDGSLMVKMSDDGMSAEKEWSAVGPNERSTEALHSIISTPVWIGDYIYGVDSYGEFRCISDADGTRIWSSEQAVPKARWSTVHFVQNGDDTWMFNERGELLVGQLSPQGYTEISRAKLIEPTLPQLRQRGGVCWSHPAFADRKIFLRNDKELICVSLAAE